MAHKIIQKRFRGTLDVLISQEEGKYYAHCLSFDLLAEGDTRHQAEKKLAEMIFEHVRFYLKNNMEQFLFHPAPMKYWEILKMIKHGGDFVPRIPEGLLRATSPNRISSYLNSLDAPAST